MAKRIANFSFSCRAVNRKASSLFCKNNSFCFVAAKITVIFAYYLTLQKRNYMEIIEHERIKNAIIDIIGEDKLQFIKERFGGLIQINLNANEIEHKGKDKVSFAPKKGEKVVFDDEIVTIKDIFSCCYGGHGIALISRDGKNDMKVFYEWLGSLPNHEYQNGFIWRADIHSIEQQFSSEFIELLKSLNTKKI